MKIYVDESGFTGADYCNEDQPLYVLGCTWFDDDFANSIEAPILKECKHSELKFSKLIKTRKGHNALKVSIDLITGSSQKEYFAAYVVHKKTALVRKFVMDCIEPAYYQDGIDLLSNGGSVAYANLLHCTLPTFMGQSWFDDFLLLYNQLIRSQTKEANEKLHKHCLKTLNHVEVCQMLSPYIAKPDLIFSEFSRSGYRSDIYEQIIFGLVVHIRNEFGIKNFNLVLDETKATTPANQSKLLSYLERLTESHKVSNDCTVYEDIKIASIGMEDSKNEIGVRMSDLVAGLFSWSLKSKENIGSDIGKYFLDRISDKNLIHMIYSDQLTAESLGMEGFANPWG